MVKLDRRRTFKLGPVAERKGDATSATDSVRVRRVRVIKGKYTTYHIIAGECYSYSIKRHSALGQKPIRVQTHQSHKAAQLWLLKCIKLPIEFVSFVIASLLSFIASELMQCTGIVIKLEAKEKR